MTPNVKGLKSITGPLFAVPTPFDVNGEIHLSAYCDFLGFISERGVEGVVVNGTTGEFSSLDKDERQMLYTTA